MTTPAFLFVLAFVLNNFSPSLSTGMMGGPSCGGSGMTDPGLAGSYVPQCDNQGNCMPQQCQGSTGYCWCVTSDCQEIPNTRFPPYGQKMDCNARRNNYGQNTGGSIMVVPGGCTGTSCNNNNYNPNQGCVGGNCNNNNQQQQCNKPNEMWMQCMPACEEFCYGKPADCGMGAGSCVPGCTCRPGYARQGASALDPCVPRSQCQGTPNICTGNNCNTGNNNQQCNNPNEMWMQCMPACEESCAGKPADCGMGPTSCTSGCSCRSGYVRQGPSSIAPCVPRSQCQGNPNICTGNNCNTGNICTGTGCVGQPSGSCSDPNAMFQSCGSACPETCQGAPSACSMQCVQGCFCKPGYVKQSNDPNALCLLKSQCITTGTGCIGNNCNTGNPCTGPGCTGTITGSCSDPYAEFKTCASACPESCQGTPSACTMQCVMGCSCRPGYVKQTAAQNSICVRRDQCNINVPCTGSSCVVMPPTGNNNCQDPNSQYQMCGSSCPPSCQQRNSMCGYSCVQGCFCKSGYVKLTSATNAPCVRQDQCNSYVGFRFMRFF